MQNSQTFYRLKWSYHAQIAIAEKFSKMNVLEMEFTDTSNHLTTNPQLGVLILSVWKSDFAGELPTFATFLPNICY